MARAGAGEHDLLAAPYLAIAAQIYGWLEAERRAARAQPPAAAFGQAQNRRRAVLGQAGLDVGMQVETDREGRRPGAAPARVEPVLAAQIAAWSQNLSG